MNGTIPDDDEFAFEPTVWWRAIDSAGTVWCESSNEREVRDRSRPGDKIQRLYRRTEHEWREQS